MFFSPPVSSYQVLVPQYQVFEVVQKLIQTGNVQFDLRSSDEASDPYFLIYSRVKFLKNKVLKMLETIEGKYHEQITEMTQEQKTQTIIKMRQYIKGQKVDHLKYLDYEQIWLEDKINKFSLTAHHYDSFIDQHTKLQEQLDALRAKMEICQNREIIEEFVILSGVCKNESILMLERIIFRQSKGHSISSFKSRETNSSTSVFLCLMNKNVFKHAGPKIAKSCQNNGVNLYEFPNVLKHMELYEKQVIIKLREAKQVLEMSGKELTEVLRDSVVGDGSSLKQHLLRVSYLERLICIVCKSKKVGGPSAHVVLTFHTPSNKILPQLPATIFPLEQSLIKHRTIMPRLKCLTQVNIMTELFSIPKYNQLIPSIFMFSTVPFLFGMMFSDIGHGLLLLIASYLLSLTPMFYLMAFMSMYCGFIYNQFFGMKLIRWGNLGIVQPIWGVAQNGLNFQNSLKMKISMIVAFVHMAFGMILKIVNDKKRGQHKKIIYDSLPKLCLLFTTVGYLVLLIILKWLKNYEVNQSTAPSIINCLLELYLGWNPYRKHSIFQSVQIEHEIGSILNKINICLLLLMVYNHTIRNRVQALIKLSFKKQKSGSSQRGYHQLGGQFQQGNDIIDDQITEDLQIQSNEALDHMKNHQDNYYYEIEDQHSNQLGPLEVFQFVLGLISSTTSYLRLFALSLAHAKLSALLLNMLLSTLSDPHPSISFARCVAFFTISIGMMLTLHVMQCLMHVVRLHWVQWMGKFYTGSGVLFTPEIQEAYT